jgi:hypothetical protein
MAPKAEGETAVVPPAKEEKKSAAGKHLIENLSFSILFFRPFLFLNLLIFGRQKERRQGKGGTIGRGQNPEGRTRTVCY